MPARWSPRRATVCYIERVNTTLLPLTRTLSAGEILDTVFRLFRNTLVSCLVLALAGVIAGQAPSALDLARGTLGTELAEKDALWWLVMVVSTLLSLVVYTAATLRQLDLAHGRPTALGANVSGALRLMPRAIGLTLVFALAIGVPSGVCFAVWQGGNFVVSAVVIVLAVLLVSWLLIPMTLSMPILAIEDGAVGATLRRAFQLVRGHWWRTTLVLTAGFIVILVFYSVGGLVGVLVAQLLGGLDFAVFAVVTTVVTALLGGLFMPFYTALSLVLVHELRLRHDGSDLGARIGALAN